jgi:signal transduction histidine kinase
VQAAGLTLFVLIANAVAMTVALAMFFLVLWQAPRERDNQLMALYVLTVIFFSSVIFGARLVAVVGQNPATVFYSVFLGRSLTSLALFALVAQFAGLWRQRWVILMLVVMTATVVFAAPWLYRGYIVEFLEYSPDGLLHYRVQPLGYVALLAYFGFDCTALACLWAARHGRARSLLAGAVLMAASFFLGGAVPALRQYPIAAVAGALSSILFARAILREKLFNPLVQLNQELAAVNTRLQEGQRLLAAQNEQLQTQMREREELIEELNAFAHTVAHDLKSPLSPIAGYAEMLLHPDSALPADEQREMLAAIQRNAQDLSHIIDALLLLAGVRQHAVERVPLDMGRIIERVLARLAYTIDASQAMISVAPTWPVAMGYERWVEEVWVNYLTNAIKYGGQPPRIEIGATPGGRRHRFWVRDNGRGLSADDRAQLFTPFTRLEQGRVEGHGLGLSIVHRIVEKLGGTVAVESRGVPGQGSEFSFTLPAARSEAKFSDV